jgi:hypothetical protein
LFIFRVLVRACPFLRVRVIYIVRILLVLSYPILIVLVIFFRVLFYVLILFIVYRYI